MHGNLLETIQSNSKALLDSENLFQKVLEDSKDPQGNGIDGSLKIPDTDYSLSDIEIGVSSLLSFVSNLDVQPSILVPRSYLENLSTKISELKNQFDAARTNIETLKTQGGVRSVDKANFAFIPQNGNQVSILKQIRRIFGGLDSALAAWFQLRLVTDSPKLSEFGGMLDIISAKRSEIDRFIEENRKFRKSTDEQSNKLNELLTQAGNERAEVARLLKDAQNDRKTLNEYAAEGASKVAEVQKSHQAAVSLSNAVNEYKSNFDRFDQQLKSREERFIKENSELDKIHERLNSDQNEVKRLTNEAEGMLRGATNAGLAASFSALQEKINLELKWARFSFYLSIFILMLSSLPIALYVFPGLRLFLKSMTGIDMGILVPTSIETHATPDVIAQVIARALLLIPGIWLVRFTGARHERLFRLREHYSYKYSIASSVEGFKRQAPELEQGIAATAFYELTFNPATRMDANSHESRHPNPAIEWMMKKLGGSGSGK